MEMKWNWFRRKEIDETWVGEEKEKEAEWKRKEMFSQNEFFTRHVSAGRIGYAVCGKTQHEQISLCSVDFNIFVYKIFQTLFPK